MDKEKALIEKMARLGIREEDMVESFIRAKGPGGQNVNKVSACVYLKHIPTGIEVKCQRERAQAINRYIARKILIDKIEALALRKRLEKRQQLEKLRRKMRPRPQKLKLKILEAKRRRSRIKSLRHPVRQQE